MNGFKLTILVTNNLTYIGYMEREDENNLVVSSLTYRPIRLNIENISSHMGLGEHTMKYFDNTTIDYNIEVGNTDYPKISTHVFSYRKTLLFRITLPVEGNIRGGKKVVGLATNNTLTYNLFNKGVKLTEEQNAEILFEILSRINTLTLNPSFPFCYSGIVVVRENIDLNTTNCRQISLFPQEEYDIGFASRQST